MMLHIILYIVLSLLGLLCLITLIGLIGFFLVFRSCDKDRSDLTFNFRSSGKPVDIESMEFKEHIINRLYEIYEQNGFFPTYVKAFLSGDKRWDIRAMWENFKRDPDIRWQILFLALPQMILNKKKSMNSSIKIGMKDAFVNKVSYPLINSLITEQLLIYLGSGPKIPEETKIKLKLMIVKNISELISKHSNTAKGVDVRKTISKAKCKNKILNYILSEQWSFPESDTNGVISSLYCLFYSALKKGILCEEKKMEKIIVSQLENTLYVKKLSEHFNTAKKFSLPQNRELIRSDLKCYLSYLIPGMNDADPAVNINILHALFINRDMWKLKDNDECLKQITAVLEYLNFLAQENLLFCDILFQFYYTLPAVIFLWERFYSEYCKLSALECSVFDVKNLIPLINIKAQEYCNKDKDFTHQSAHISENIFECALLARAFPKYLGLLHSQIKKMIGDEIQDNLCYEFFCGFYPLKAVYGNPALTLSLLLNVLK